MKSAPRTRAVLRTVFGLGLAMGTILAHRLDECLQAALIDFGTDEVRVFLSITPGTEVAARFLDLVDTDGDGVLRPSETAAYATNAVRQLVLRIDDTERRLELKSFRIPDRDTLRTGAGTIQIEAGARVSPWTEGAHFVRFENHHLTNLSVYVVSALQPEAPGIAIGRQSRNDVQSGVDIRLTTMTPR